MISDMKSDRKHSGFLKKIYRSSLNKLEDPLIREKLKGKIHAVENEKSGVIFCRDDISAFTCPIALKKSLVCFLEGASRSRATLEYSSSEFDFDTLLHTLLLRNVSKTQKKETSVKERKLDRLVLNISNACNLQCRYCYAGGGTYGSGFEMMDKTTARAVIDCFRSNFDSIEKLQFFGGEPLLNPGLIIYVCQEFAERQNRGEIRKCPQYSVVTNGTIFSDEIFKLLKKYEIRPTISMDGPEAINDELRGKGTTKKTERFINHLEKFGIDYSFEGTYTSRHVESGLYLSQLLDFFFRRYGHHELHIPPASLSSEHPLFMSEHQIAAIYRDGVEYSMANLAPGRTALLSFASRIMDVFVQKNPINNYCPAGLSTLSVDAGGFVYPCFMFTGQKNYQMGNVSDDTFPVRNSVMGVLNKIIEQDKSHNPECQQCWASPFCSGCIGADAVTNQGNLAKKSCVLTKAMVEAFLVKIPEVADTLLHKESESSLPDTTRYQLAAKNI